jgi:hypothetical protein
MVLLPIIPPELFRKLPKKIGGGDYPEPRLRPLAAASVKNPPLRGQNTLLSKD